MISPFVFFAEEKKWMPLATFILIFVNVCVAQENVRFERISVNEGLSQSDVKTMVQDQFGFLWVGTRDGLNRFDGFQFLRYDRDQDDSTSLYFNQILDLATDSSNNIWIGSTGGISIYHYVKNRFENFLPRNPEFQGIEVYHILVTSKNTALLSTNKGVVNFDKEQRRFFISEEILLFKNMHAYYAWESPSHELWVATDQGVFIKSPARNDWVRHLNDHRVYHIHGDPNGKAYLSTSTGLFTCDLEKKVFVQKPMPRGSGSVNEVMRMNNGDLWIACNKVIVFDTNDSLKYVLGHEKFNNYSLSEDRARVLYQTDDDVIWVGTFGYGLNKFNPDVSKFSYLSEQTSIPLSSNYVSTVFTMDDTLILVGTSRGLDVIDLQQRSAKHFSREGDLFQVLQIIADRKKNIWLTTSEGLMLYSDDKLILKNSSLQFAYDACEWDDTTLMVATRVHGIFLFDTKTNSIRTFIPSTDLLEEVSCILVEGDHLWIGCKDVLKLYNRRGELLKQFTSNDKPGSLHSSFVKSLFRDSKKNLWIGTWGGGLCKLNTRDSTFTTYDIDDGLPNNVIYGGLEDDTGTLWVSTNLGISAFNARDQTFRNFDFSDGLQSNEFNTGAYFKSTQGRLYFGGVNGLTFFNPKEILGPRSAWSIKTTSITVNNKQWGFNASDSIGNVLMINKITSSWKENDIGVTFTVVDFKQAQRYHFQYSIEDTTWYNMGNRRSLELIDLPSGQHEIKIRSKLPGNNWSQSEVLFAIHIVPPVWQQTWFRVIFFLGFSTLIFSAYRYRVVRLKKVNLRLNALVNDRTKEIEKKNSEIAVQNEQLQELNRELQSFSYSVSHDLRAPLRSVLGYSQILEEDFNERLGEKGKEVLQVIRKNATRMNNLIEDLLKFSKLDRQELQKTETDTRKLLNSVIDEISSFTQHKAEIKLRETPATWADTNLLSHVWMNLVSNAIKYSAKKHMPVVEIGSQIHGDEIIFYVKDNGAGFDMKYADKLFNVFQRLHTLQEFEGTGIGLALVRRIVARHGGRVWAEGKVNEGATFYFSLPWTKRSIE